MEKFIRLDKKGTWMGAEHRSHFVAYEYEEDEKYLENGVSCYYATIEGIENLYKYANKNMSLEYEDLKDMQLTVFEGNYSGQGSDGEELAWCKNTIAELDALEWMKILDKAKEDFEYEEEISENEYKEIILKATGLN